MVLTAQSAIAWSAVPLARSPPGRPPTPSATMQK